MQYKHYFWLLPFISFISGYFFLTLFFSTKNIETPSLVGKTIHEASLILSENQLNIRIINQKNSSDLPAGTIISQSPAANQKIKPQQSIFLVLSKQPEKPAITDFRTKLLNDINIIVDTLNTTKTIYQLPSSYPHNQCIAQLPLPNELLNKNGLILYVSQENYHPILWPNFKNKRVDDVRDFLTSYNITPEIIHTHQPKEGHACQHCYVIDQRPIAGSLISFDRKKNLRIQLQVEYT